MENRTQAGTSTKGSAGVILRLCTGRAPASWRRRTARPTARTYNPNTNRISTAGFAYDAAGNLTADGTHSYEWDGEGRLVTVDNGATIVLVHNALGQQVGGNGRGRN